MYHELAENRGCQIVEGNLRADHVRMCTSISPKHLLASVLVYLKRENRDKCRAAVWRPQAQSHRKSLPGTKLFRIDAEIGRGNGACVHQKPGKGKRTILQIKLRARQAAWRAADLGQA